MNKLREELINKCDGICYDDLIGLLSIEFENVVIDRINELDMDYNKYDDLMFSEIIDELDININNIIKDKVYKLSEKELRVSLDFININNL